MSLLSVARLKEHRGNTDLFNYYVDEKIYIENGAMVVF